MRNNNLGQSPMKRTLACLAKDSSLYVARGRNAYYAANADFYKGE